GMWKGFGKSDPASWVRIEPRSCRSAGPNARIWRRACVIGLYTLAAWTGQQAPALPKKVEGINDEDADCSGRLVRGERTGSACAGVGPASGSADRARADQRRQTSRAREDRRGVRAGFPQSQLSRSLPGAFAAIGP